MAKFGKVLDHLMVSYSVVQSVAIGGGGVGGPGRGSTWETQ